MTRDPSLSGKQNKQQSALMHSKSSHKHRSIGQIVIGEDEDIYETKISDSLFPNTLVKNSA